ncbi:MAG: hypothetical protein R2911_00780 [Caldilineaceae bacterium]
MTEALAAQLNTVGFWVSFLLALFTFSAIVRDNALARLAQHIFVGAALGYLAVLLVQNVLRPRLITPLVQNGFGDYTISAPAILGVLLLLAGIDRAIVQGGNTERPRPLGRRILYGLGMCGVAILLGVGISTTVLGAVQGTLAPQFAATSQSSGLSASVLPAAASVLPAAAWDQIVAAVVMLVVTSGVLVHLYVEPVLLNTAHPVARFGLTLWTWLGKRVLWLSAGVLFARLILSRVSLLGAQIDYFGQVLRETPLWPVVVALREVLGF